MWFCLSFIFIREFHIWFYVSPYSVPFHRSPSASDSRSRHVCVKVLLWICCSISSSTLPKERLKVKRFAGVRPPHSLAEHFQVASMAHGVIADVLTVMRYGRRFQHYCLGVLLLEVVKYLNMIIYERKEMRSTHCAVTGRCCPGNTTRNTEVGQRCSHNT